VVILQNIDLCNLSAAVGIGISVAAVAWLAKNVVSVNTMTTPKKGTMKIPKRFKKFLPSVSGELNGEDKTALILSAAGFVLTYLLGKGTQYSAYMALSGMSIGALASRLIFKFRKSAITYGKRRQVAVLFEATEMFIRSGMSVPQALNAAKSLTPLLSQAVKSCLVRWPSNPDLALDLMRKDIGVLEADVLVSLLQRIKNTGIKNLEGVMQRESQNIDRLRSVAIQMKISNRPIYYMVHRILPAIAILGMFIGPLIYRLGSSFSAVGIAP